MPPLSASMCPLLTGNVIAKVKEQRITTVVDYVSCDVIALSRSTGLPHELLAGIRQALLAQYASLPTSASEIWRDTEKTAAILPTGCENIDTLLEGGVMVGELTELTGAPATGKTQLCHSLAAAVAMETSSTILWVDSTGAFSPSRLRNNLIRGGAREEAIPALMERVRVEHIFCLFDLFSLVGRLSQCVAGQTNWFSSNLHLLLLDSLSPLLAPLLGGRQVHGHALLSHLASQLRQLAFEHSVAVVYTNTTVSASLSSGGLKPALGQTWSYVPHTRITLTFPTHTLTSRILTSHTLTTHTDYTAERNGDGVSTERVATLTKSSRMAVGIATCFSITGQGLESPSNHSQTYNS